MGHGISDSAIGNGTRNPKVHKKISPESSDPGSPNVAQRSRTFTWLGELARPRRGERKNISFCHYRLKGKTKLES
jgi:hypothetical protein